jgi:hypothetical protein
MEMWQNFVPKYAFPNNILSYTEPSFMNSQGGNSCWGRWIDVKLESFCPNAVELLFFFWITLWGCECTTGSAKIQIITVFIDSDIV